MSEIVLNSIEVKNKRIEELEKKNQNLTEKKEEHLEEIEKYSEIMHHIEESGLIARNIVKSVIIITIGFIIMVAGMLTIPAIMLIGLAIEIISIIPIFKNLKLEKTLDQYEETCDDKQIAIKAINDILGDINREKENMTKEIKELKKNTTRRKKASKKVLA